MYGVDIKIGKPTLSPARRGREWRLPMPYVAVIRMGGSLRGGGGWG